MPPSIEEHWMNSCFEKKPGRFFYLSFKDYKFDMDDEILIRAIFVVCTPEETCGIK